MAERQGKLPATVYDLQKDQTDGVISSSKISTKRAATAGALVGAAILAIVHYMLSTFTHGSYSWLGSSRCTPSRSWVVDDSLNLRPKVEAVFLAVPNNESAIAASKLYATSPHLAGSEQDLVTARQILDLFQRELGIKPPKVEPMFDAGSPESQHAIRSLTTKHHRQHRPNAWIDTYYPIINTGVKQQLQILGKDGKPVWEANLEEIADMSDPDAGQHRTDIPTWHGLSKGGDVSGPVVYAKYGRKEDFDELVHAGVDLKGTIAIVRYGMLFRGLKIKAAQEAGCIGILIYSDPIDDGYVTSKDGFKEWPYGPARNSNSVQRGSVQFISMYPGDPTTPGYPAYKNATRLEPVNTPSIPSLPISWNNAKKLLEQIGHGVKSESHIRLYNEVEDKVTPIWNVMAVIPGTHREYNEVVIVGNHRDAWVMGAADPISGTASLHEVVRGLGALLRKGWKPRRTIVIASWDGEEYGLIGSTEWGEDFADWIQEHAVAYLNLDVAVCGSRYHVLGSPSLAHLIRDTASAIPHPTLFNKTLWDARVDEGPFKKEGKHLNDYRDSAVVIERMREEAMVISQELPVAPLGSGSDYTVMLQRLGVASTDMGFGFTPSDPVYHYHSIYDSQLWQEKYADPGFHRHVAVAKHLGLMTLRLADSPLLPINTTHYARELFKYLEGVADTAKLTGVPVDLHPIEAALHQLLNASLALDSKKKLTLQHLQRSRPIHVRIHASVLNKLNSFISRLSWGTSVPDRFASPAHGSGTLRVRRNQSAINKKLASFERGFLSDAGIKDREWYRHLGVAPGKWKGYGATPFPALSEAIEIEKDADLAEAEVARLVKVLEKLRDTLKA